MYLIGIALLAFAILRFALGIVIGINIGLVILALMLRFFAPDTNRALIKFLSGAWR